MPTFMGNEVQTPMALTTRTSVHHLIMYKYLTSTSTVVL